MPRQRDEFDGLNERNLRPLVNAFQRLDPRAQLVVVVVLLVAGVIALVVYYRMPRQQTVSASATANLLLGNPSGATPVPANRDNYLMVKPYFTLGYNDSRGTPNWVSWRVTSADLGDAPRKQTFDADNSLPIGFTVVTHEDYTSSGFDRGHMCPHGDRSAMIDASYSTFVMTNIIPQAPNVNRKAWEQLESYCRELVRLEHVHLYIISGPAGTGGTGSHGPRERIGHDKVLVPAQCWKVAVLVPEDGGEDDLAKITPSTRVIAVMMPNDNDSVGEEWDGFRTSPANIEQQTGLHFFTALPAPLAQALRQKVDYVPIPPPVARHYAH